MDIGSAFIASLVEFYTVVQIRDLWRQAAEAMMSKQTVNIHLSGTSFEAQSGTGIPLNTSLEQATFISACKAAIAQLEGNTAVPVSQLGTGVDFSQRAVGA